jgi:energy-coupling factor transport system permease protein
MSARRSRPLHPGAWWLWALGMATAASRTTNPLVLAMFCGTLATVVVRRRSDAPWARGFGAYLKLSLVVIAVRVVFRAVLGGQYGPTVLFTLPSLHLPQAAAGVQLGGPVTLESVLAAVYDGVRLATLLLCVGAANVLADPKRLLKSLPGALYEMGAVVTVALTVAPQLIESGQRIRKARRLRAVKDRRHVVRSILLPVLEDALDHGRTLASAMDSRGYGRTAGLPRSTRLVSAGLVLGGVVGVCVGTYGVLDGTTPRLLGAPVLTAGAVLAAAGLWTGGKRVRRTVYRPAPWRWPEWLVVGCGAAAAATMFVSTHVDPDNLYPSLQPLRWPGVGLLAIAAALVGALPAWLAPPVTAAPVPSAVPAASAPSPMAAVR